MKKLILLILVVLSTLSVNASDNAEMYAYGEEIRHEEEIHQSKTPPSNVLFLHAEEYQIFLLDLDTGRIVIAYLPDRVSVKYYYYTDIIINLDKYKEEIK
jgi:hypothetical protein